MGTPDRNEYVAFEEKVKRTVYIDNLSHLATDAVLKTALGQFGNVRSVQFIPNYTESRNIPQVALVEMENTKEAEAVVAMMTNYPFMMSGMPRPVRARRAEAEMFGDRPIKPGRKIRCQWVLPGNPDFEVAKKLKNATRRHSAEASLMLKLQLEHEEKLAEQQAENLKVNYRKFERFENVTSDGTLGRLGRCYNFNITDD